MVQLSGEHYFYPKVFRKIPDAPGRPFWEVTYFKTILSGFAYSNLWEAEFPPHWSGTGNVVIALPEGYTAKKWTIQFRWPLQLRGMECFEDTLKEQDCGGDPTNSVDGKTCKEQLQTILSQGILHQLIFFLLVLVIHQL